MKADIKLCSSTFSVVILLVIFFLWSSSSSWSLDKKRETHCMTPRSPDLIPL